MGEDACNKITLMCLKACRRLPLNAPCISLRLTKSTPLEVKQEAVKALLSGGAHPILYHDEKMVEGMYTVHIMEC
jgi:pyruvate-formate lyase